MAVATWTRARFVGRMSDQLCPALVTETGACSAWWVAVEPAQRAPAQWDRGSATIQRLRMACTIACATAPACISRGRRFQPHLRLRTAPWRYWPTAVVAALLLTTVRYPVLVPVTVTVMLLPRLSGEGGS